MPPSPEREGGIFLNIKKPLAFRRGVACLPSGRG